MSCPCHCYNPEDAFVADAETESVDSYADLPPLVPAPAPAPAVAPQPLFSAADTKDFVDLYKSTKRDRMTKEYQHHIDDAINDLLALRGDVLKEEMRGAIAGADGIEKLSIQLYCYTKAKPTGQNYGFFTDRDGNWWMSLDGYCASITTTLGGVDVDFLVRETHFLRQLTERIGSPQNFIISKRVGVPVDYGTHRAIPLTLQLEFWPKGVTMGRRIQCSNP